MMPQAPAFWYAPKTRKHRLAVAALEPLGRIYGWAARKRFDLHFPVPMAKPVVCVGNITAGGAGKTPVALSLCDLLRDRGYNPHFLTRGYGGAEEGPLQVAPNRDTAADVGDEALLLVRKAPTWVSRNRAQGAQQAMDTGANVIIMDDGFQNPSMYKDVSLVVVDGAVGFGNKRVMPAGPLREDPAFGFSRAQAAVIVGEDRAGVEEDIRRYADIPVFRARLVPAAENPDVRGREIFAFAGIGRPQKFRETLAQAGAIVEGWGAFPDHYAYAEEDLKEIFDAAGEKGAPVITTEKDHVRLPPAYRDRALAFAVTLEWEDPAAVTALVEAALRKR